MAKHLCRRCSGIGDCDGQRARGASQSARRPRKTKKRKLGVCSSKKCAERHFGTPLLDLRSRHRNDAASNLGGAARPCPHRQRNATHAHRACCDAPARGRLRAAAGRQGDAALDGEAAERRGGGALAAGEAELLAASVGPSVDRAGHSVGRTIGRTQPTLE